LGPTRLIREVSAREARDVVVTRSSTYENRGNLAPGFFEQVIRKYEGTRLGRQELNAELLDDTPGALWNHRIIDTARQAAPPNLARIVVAIDPAATSGEDADETGIVVVAKDNHGHGYVLAALFASSLFHGGNTGSKSVGDANKIDGMAKWLREGRNSKFSTATNLQIARDPEILCRKSSAWSSRPCRTNTTAVLASRRGDSHTLTQLRRFDPPFRDFRRASD
jgi:hypothetical protein